MTKKTTLSPRCYDGSSWTEAYDLACSLGEPVFTSLAPFCDDRGWSLMNLFAGSLSVRGQINVSVQYPGVVKAWHRHRKQTDFWICVHGHLKVGVHCEDRGQSWAMVIGEKRPGALVIPPPLWHGAATVSSAPATLLYFVTEQYDAADPDEERRAWDSIAGFKWTTEHC